MQYEARLIIITRPYRAIRLYLPLRKLRERIPLLSRLVINVLFNIQRSHTPVLQLIVVSSAN